MCSESLWRVTCAGGSRGSASGRRPSSSAGSPRPARYGAVREGLLALLDGRRPATLFAMKAAHGVCPPLGDLPGTAWDAETGQGRRNGTGERGRFGGRSGVVKSAWPGRLSTHAIGRGPTVSHTRDTCRTGVRDRVRWIRSITHAVWRTAVRAQKSSRNRAPGPRSVPRAPLRSARPPAPRPTPLPPPCPAVGHTQWARDHCHVARRDDGGQAAPTPPRPPAPCPVRQPHQGAA
jgi:hypothetical protein